MTRNIGAIDRTLRIVLGVGLLALAFFGPQSPWGYIGIVPLVTALAGFCPAYRLFGIRTCSVGGTDSAADTSA